MEPLIAIALALFHSGADLAYAVVPNASTPAPITFYFQNRHEQATFPLIDYQETARPEVVKQFSHFVRCWRTEREKPMHPRLIEIVAAISRHFEGARIEVVSGYRARPYGAPHSKHFLGRAMDIHLEGISAKKVAAWVWTNFRHVGVGLYPQQDFMHVDVRDIDVRWVDQARHGESAHAHYFGRRPTEEAAPDGAPRLAYDRVREAEAQTLAIAQVAVPWPPPSN